MAACLHSGLRRGSDYLDPLLLLAAARMRLYPSRVLAEASTGDASTS